MSDHLFLILSPHIHHPTFIYISGPGYLPRYLTFLVLTSKENVVIRSSSSSSNRTSTTKKRPMPFIKQENGKRKRSEEPQTKKGEKYFPSVVINDLYLAVLTLKRNVLSKCKNVSNKNIQYCFW